MSEEHTNETTTDDTPDEPSIYDQIVAITAAPYSADTFDTVDDWKEYTVRHFNKMSDADFTALALPLKLCVNELTTAYKTVQDQKKAGKKRLSKLPPIPGLVEPKKTRGRKPNGAAAPVKATGKKSTGKKTGPKTTTQLRRARGTAATAPGEKKIRGPNRYLRAARALLRNPDLNKYELSKECNFQLNAAQYCIEAFRACLTAFKEVGFVPPEPEVKPEAAAAPPEATAPPPPEQESQPEA